jgi:hypothetical protein
MTVREIEASTEVAQTLLGHSKGHQGATVATPRIARELGHVPCRTFRLCNDVGTIKPENTALEPPLVPFFSD